MQQYAEVNLIGTDFGKKVIQVFKILNQFLSLDIFRMMMKPLELL